MTAAPPSLGRMGTMGEVHNKRAGTAPADAVYIGRGSPWGNPFKIGEHGTRDEVCDRFEREILPTLDLEPLRGRDLICWCKPARCHGDAILRALQAQSTPPISPEEAQFNAVRYHERFGPLDEKGNPLDPRRRG